jgi:hypothetical protein
LKVVRMQKPEGGIVVPYWIFTVEGDWIVADLRKHLDYLLPKVIRLMVKNNRPEEDIKAVLDIYAYYYALSKIGLLTSPVIAKEVKQ